MTKVEILEELVKEETQRLQQSNAQLNEAYRVNDIIKNTLAGLQHKLNEAKKEK